MDERGTGQGWPSERKTAAVSSSAASLQKDLASEKSSQGVIEMLLPGHHQVNHFEGNGGRCQGSNFSMIVGRCNLNDIGGHQIQSL